MEPEGNSTSAGNEDRETSDLPRTEDRSRGGAGRLRQMVTFFLGDEEFGVDITHVREINRLMLITPVPRAPASVEGVINLRGQVVPVVDLRRQFGLPALEHDRRTRIVVVDLEGTAVGFLVDEVSEVLRLPESAVESPPAMVGSLESKYISGVGKIDDRLLIILDLPHLVTGAGEGGWIVQA
ncbi:MAG: chemotaxis protein CheW [Proteobacteria bacterium]|nr:chemotaxis protein CheW [Pseudomonadota bacterium]MBU1742975.1 chemotaxis protein CheW [Pseudomonadota bacterium]